MFCSPPGPILQRDPGQLPTYPAPQQRGKQTTFVKYNTIRDGGSTALNTAYTVGSVNTVYTVHCLSVYTVYTVFTVYIVYTVYTVYTA